MSHVVTIKSQVKDESCARLAALTIGAKLLEPATTRMYGPQGGFGIQLSRGTVIVFDLATGEYRGDADAIRYDKGLPAFMQAYGVEVAKKAARLRGRTLVRTIKEANGSVRLVFAG